MIKRLPIMLSALALVLVVVPQVGAAEKNISDNGSSSVNKIDVKETNTNVNTQTNQAYTYNNVSVSMNTGNNNVSSNTGGDNSVKSGDAEAEVVIVNDINYNHLVSGDCCPKSGGESNISDNGSRSINTIISRRTDTTVNTQVNKARTTNKVDVDVDSGSNNVSKNTGGDNEVDTGDLKVGVGIVNEINDNVMESDDCGCPEDDSSVNISDNGERSKNTVKETTTNTEVDSQVNDARTTTKVDVDASSGSNRLRSNTGGSNTTQTGSMSVFISLLNRINTNLSW